MPLPGAVSAPAFVASGNLRPNNSPIVFCGRSNEMAAHGTTTVEAKSGYGLSLDSEIKSLEAIQQATRQWPGTVVATLLGAHVPPPEYRDYPDEYVRIVCEEMIPEAAQRGLAEYVDVFCERGAFTAAQSVRILQTAVEHGLKTRAHVNQLTETNLDVFARFHPASFDHMDHVSDADIAALAHTDTVATLLPAANYFLGLGTFPPARKLVDAGVAVALATDYNPGTSPTTSMPFVLSVACTHMNMSPAEAITAATINGACALGLQDRKGSLAPGKDADIAIFRSVRLSRVAVLVWGQPLLEDATQRTRISSRSAVRIKKQSQGKARTGTGRQRVRHACGRYFGFGSAFPVQPFSVSGE